jgi:serine/threonine-protein kinase
MEYIDGRSLAEIIRLSGPLPAPEVVRVGLGVAAGLRVGLAQGLIHRDIKPANILLPHQGDVKIVDLGLALGNGPGDDPQDETPTGQSLVVGTYGYMSPEQAADARKVDFRSDIYALGATLYEAATGSLPFSPRDPNRWLQMQRQEVVPPPQTRRPDLPPALCTLLLEMLALRPDERPGSYEALETALRHALDANPAAAHEVKTPITQT